MRGGGKEDVRVVALEVEPGSEAMGDGRDAARVLEPVVLPAATGQGDGPLRERPILGDELGEALVAAVPRVDVENDGDAVPEPPGDVRIGPTCPPGRDDRRVDGGVLEALGSEGRDGVLPGVLTIGDPAGALTGADGLEWEYGETLLSVRQRRVEVGGHGHADDMIGAFPHTGHAESGGVSGGSRERQFGHLMAVATADSLSVPYHFLGIGGLAVGSGAT